MGIVSKVEDKQEQEITYPCLMRNKVIGFVVLFSSVKTGVVLHKGEDSFPDIGHYFNDWVSATNKSLWEPSPPVTLSNA